MLFACCFLIVLVIGAELGYWPVLVACVYILMSTITILVYKWDKRLAIHAATEDSTRVSERSLHILALLCGWPGALLGQQWFRHKSKKNSFIAMLWLTIIINTSVLACYYYWLYS